MYVPIHFRNYVCIQFLNYIYVNNYNVNIPVVEQTRKRA